METGPNEPAGVVWVVGSLNEDVVVALPRLPERGETVSDGRLRRGPGGKGLNAAVAAARAGAQVRLVGAIGDDLSGARLREVLVTEGIEDDVATVTAPTGTAIVLVAAGENAIAVAPGANRHLDPARAATSAIGPRDVVTGVLELAQGTLAAWFSAAKRAGARTMLNASPAAPLDTGLLEVCDLLVVNETEAHAVAGIDDHALRPRRREVKTTEARDARLADALVNATGVTAIVTLGARGALLAGVDGSRTTVPAVTADAVDPTGAGDTLFGVLAASMAKGASLEAGLARATRAAAITVSRWGAVDAIPTAAEISADDPS